MGLLTEVGRIGLKIMFHYRFDLKYTYDDFNPKTSSPYLLIGNHATQHDPLIVGMVIKRYPYPVANSFLYTNPIFKWLLTKVVTSISKRKGQSDMQTIRLILDAIHKQNRPVMLFPEGNASYFGEQTKTDFLPTAKLIKKLNVDVIVAKISGGYLAHPRWGFYRKNGYFHTHFYSLYKADDLKELPVESIQKTLEEAMIFNDFNWNLTHQHPYRLKGRANGIEHYLYYCPKCHETQSIYGKNEHIHCKNCGVIATFDQTSKLTGPYPSLVEWGNAQKKIISTRIKQPIITQGKLYEVHNLKQKKHKLGIHEVKLENQTLTIQTKPKRIFNIQDIQGEVITRKNNFSFDYEDKTYNFLLKDPMLILNTISYIKEN
jgi:1-acyl-sn-glycerol-3-phosphate acyltransferase